MKKFNWFVLFFVSALMLILGGCFSPFGADETNVTISLGDMSRVAVTQGEIDGFTYEVILDGPGGRRTETFSGTSTSIRVRPGTYNVIVRAIGDRPSVYEDNPGLPAPVFNFPARMLRGWGCDRVTIQRGQDNPIPIKMATATEVTTYQQLNAALDQWVLMGTREHIIVIKSDITSFDPAGSYSVVGQVRLVAENTSTINLSGASFIIPNNPTNPNRLTLGKEGMGGKLTLDGGNAPFDDPLIDVDDELIMNDGVVLRNRNRSSGDGGGVIVYNDGIFTMYGGIIEGNTAVRGGGVFVSPTGIFIVERGIIRNNRAARTSGGDAEGGGIYTNGTLIVNDFIEISGNRAQSVSGSGRGGGIYWIDGNISINNCRISNNYASFEGGGIYKTANYNYLSITIDAGNITGNIAVDDGGGLGGGGWGGGPPTGPTINISPNVNITGNTLSNGTPSNGWPP